MRIMHISTRLILGGSQENTVLSCEGQVARGHEVSLVHGPIFGPEGSLQERAESFRAGERRIELIESPHLVRQVSPWHDVKAYFALRRLVRQWRPQVVHTHSSKAGVLGRLAAWKEQVPGVVHTIHGPPFHRFEKRWRNTLYVSAERMAARRCHRLIGVCDAMRDEFLAEEIGAREQFATVYSGMEVEPYLTPRWAREQVRGELGLQPTDFVAGTIARLAELKGHDDLLDALGPLMHARPRLKLLWIGDGWWRPRIMRRVEELGLRDRIVTTGLVPPAMIPKYVQAMDLLIHPSYREGLPRAVPQALLSGVAVVAYDVDGTREACIEGQTGRLVAPGDLARLREAVDWMMDHDAERAAMGERGRELCRHRFDAATMVGELEVVYQSVLRDTAMQRR